MASTFLASLIGRIRRKGSASGRLLAGLLWMTVSGAGATAHTAHVAQERTALETRVGTVRKAIQAISRDGIEVRDKPIAQWLNWPNWPNWNNWNNWRNFNWLNR